MESLVKQLQAAGLTEEQIMEIYFKTFQEGKMDRKDLELCAEFMGYELTDDFKNDSTPDPIASKDVEGISKEEAKDAKEIKPDETVEDFEEKIENAKTKEKPEKSKSDDKFDEKEWEEVQNKFKW